VLARSTPSTTETKPPQILLKLSSPSSKSGDYSVLLQNLNANLVDLPTELQEGALSLSRSRV
jgi:hypothetical protein